MVEGRTYSGVVANIPTPKKWFDERKGYDIELHSFQIEGTNRWFRLGTTNPSELGIAPGAPIKFVANLQNGNVELPTVTAISANDVQQAPAPVKGNTGTSTSTAPRSGGSRDTYWEDKAVRDISVQKDIAWQAGRNAVIAILPILLEQGALPEWKANANKADKLEIMTGIVNELTQQFVDDLPSNS